MTSLTTQIPSAKVPHPSVKTPDRPQAPLSGAKDAPTATESPISVEAPAQVDVKNGGNVETAPQKTPFDGHVSLDVLELARKIADGRIRELMITPDMVGKTILVEGKIFETGTRKVPSKSTNLNAMSLKEKTDRAAMIRSSILNVFDTFKGDCLTVKDVAEIIWKDAGFSSTESCRASISRVIKRLCDEGVVSEGKTPSGFNAFVKNET